MTAATVGLRCSRTPRSKSATTKFLFKLPLWQTPGLVDSLLEMAELDGSVPDYTTLC